MRLLAKSGFLQRANRRRSARITAPDNSVQVVVLECDFKQLDVHLDGETTSVKVRVQRTTDLSLTVVVVFPPQDEVTNDLV